MRNTYVLGVLAVVWIGVFATTASAQMGGGRGSRGHYGGYGGYWDDGAAGVMGAYTSTMNYNTTRNIAEANRLAGQRAAMQQNALMQGGIRSTLTSQAENRSQDIINRQQSNRDWWFQVQQQQIAQRRAMPASAGAAPVAGFEAAAASPQVATDIIQWPQVLWGPEFAADRAKVEAPYRRTPKTNPTNADYQNMIDAAANMKMLLGKITANISAQEYLGAGKFLDQLTAEARGRIEKSKP
jgi:hypothetical protein